MFRVRYFFRTLKPRTLKFYILFLIIVVIFYFVFNFIEYKLTPPIIAIAEAKARAIATEAINKAVKDKIVKNVQYKDLISIHKDTGGQITLIQINTVEINRLESETALEVVKVLREVTMEGIALPIGAATGSKILSNYGPVIRISLFPAGTAYVNTVEAFQEAGINQTRHRIVLEIIANIKIVQPLLESDITVKTDVPLAETIIIGNVPQAILDFK
ncbi:MAG: sporulation protein YunB [Tepidanaerobacteraceae bacterium]|nr:sporulation protein YunB [Tepidanaerobacteraceae bacterium]